MKVSNQAECKRVRVVVTCIDNRGVEGQLSIGSRYEAQDIDRYGSYSHYKLRNDYGDLASYGAHRFDVQVEEQPWHAE